MRWESEAANLKAVAVIVHHKSFIYLLDWLGMNEVASLESKPSLPPTTSHLETLLKMLKIHLYKEEEGRYFTKRSGDRLTGYISNKSPMPTSVLAV